jgi:flagellar basal-body rod protein FlgG
LVTSQGYYLDVNFSLEGIPAERLTISQEGEVTHLDENGLRVELGTINLYRFTNPAGLIKDPNQQQLIASEASGEPIEGAPGEEGFGKIQQYYLEGSNVSLSVEMAALLQARRSLQASSRTLQVADELRAMTLQLRT